MKKILVIFLSVIVVLLLLTVGLLAYFGFLPGVSDRFVNRVDLGIENDPQLNQELNEKIGLQFNIPKEELPTDKDVIYEGTIEVEESLSSEQVTSILNAVKTELTSIPFSNVQIRINEDGTTEASFDLNVDTTANEARKLGYTEEEIEKGKKYLGVLGESVYIYTKLSFDMTDNNLTVNPYNFRIQNFNVPASITEMVADVGSNAIEDRLSQITNLNVESLVQVGDKLNFKGTLPASVSTAE